MPPKGVFKVLDADLVVSLLSGAATIEDSRIPIAFTVLPGLQIDAQAVGSPGLLLLLNGNRVFTFFRQNR